MAEGAGVPGGEGVAVGTSVGPGVLAEGTGLGGVVSGVGLGVVLGVVLALGVDVVRAGSGELAGCAVAGVPPPVGVDGGVTST